jgi:Na+/phosphate symporter
MFTYLTTVGNDSMVSNIRAAQPAAKHNFVAIANTLMISPFAGIFPTVVR